jgi:hypothetical protein
MRLRFAIDKFHGREENQVFNDARKERGSLIILPFNHRVETPKKYHHHAC